MDLDHIRYGFGQESTLSRLYLPTGFECFLLEDERRRVKVRGETCIPEGRYEITLRTEGGRHEDYLERFPAFHVGMLWLRDVRDFTFIYYHIGNRESQTLGCPLTGRVPKILTTGEFEVRSSEKAYVPFYRKVSAVLLSGERVFTNIREEVPT
ncbi:MAG: hypothetical protein KAJ55_00415 [Anaerolineales bacterium]|nr:hypothetical protein [Anaerolineales bacterium]